MVSTDGETTAAEQREAVERVLREHREESLAWTPDGGSSCSCVPGHQPVNFAAHVADAVLAVLTPAQEPEPVASRQVAAVSQWVEANLDGGPVHLMARKRAAEEIQRLLTASAVTPTPAVEDERCPICGVREGVGEAHDGDAHSEYATEPASPAAETENQP